MSIEASQLREFIKDVLDSMGQKYRSTAAVELLMLTAAQESHCGRWIRQVDGPAQGIFQMEPETETDVFRNVLRFDPVLHATVKDFRGQSYPAEFNLIGNIPYQIAIARSQYWRFEEPLPDADDTKALARYWKKYWNTPLGAGTIDDAIYNYLRYAKETQ